MYVTMSLLCAYWVTLLKNNLEISFKGLFNPQKYHCIYGDESIYEE